MKVKVLRMLLVITIALGWITAYADEKEDIEKVREEQLKRWGAEGLVKPYDIREKAKGYLAKPLEEQDITELKNLAKQANTTANLVGFILEEYADYYRDKYRYDFIQEKVGPFHDNYVHLSNELKDYRNQAYFNLGQKMALQGNEIEAFFYFRDAYRLSSFTESGSDHKGMRYKAEQELKKLLGITDIPSFVFWE